MTSRFNADYLLGRTYRFERRVGNTVVGLRSVQAVAFDPERGVKLDGAGFMPAWIDFFTWRRLLDEGVLVES